jgi:hypothetical protein
VSDDFADVVREFHAEIAAFKVELRQGLANQRRWMFCFWATTMLEIVVLKLI